MDVLLAVALGLALAWAVLVTLRLRGARRLQQDAADEARAGCVERDAARVRQEAVFDALSSLALRVDAGGRILQVGRTARRRFAFLTEGMSLLEAFSEHLLSGHVDEAIAALEPRRFEVRLFADGRRTFRVAVAPYAVGGAREAFVLLTDVSEAVAYQELRSQFVANVSHELRTPITGLRGLLEALDDPGMDEATRSDFIARCISETQRLEALIADILFLSELEATEGPPPADSSDLTGAVEEAAADMADLAAAQGVNVEVLADGPVACPLSERLARTVARNLIENAVKYAGPGAVARATIAAEDGRAVLRVSDNGIGIPERHMPHVFERFYRADPSRSKRMGGTGLGLSIVKHIIERYGGEVAADSREGFGTTITVSLPSPASGGRPPDHASGAL